MMMILLLFLQKQNLESLACADGHLVSEPTSPRRELGCVFRRQNFMWWRKRLLTMLELLCLDCLAGRRSTSHSPLRFSQFSHLELGT